MSKGSVNKVILIGNLGSDPEVRFTPSGVQVANFSLATSESWTDKAGERQERAEWHRIVLWRRLAEVAGQYLKRAVRSISRANCKLALGKIKTARSAIPPKSSPIPWRCLREVRPPSPLRLIWPIAIPPPVFPCLPVFQATTDSLSKSPHASSFTRPPNLDGQTRCINLVTHL